MATPARRFTRRTTLAGTAAMLGPALAPFLPNDSRQTSGASNDSLPNDSRQTSGASNDSLPNDSRQTSGVSPTTGRSGGRIANGSRRGQQILTGLFFAGPPNPNSLPLYTRHPLHADRLDWTNDADIRFALGQFASAGLNTVKLSYWGHEGETDQWSPAWLFSRQRWPGDGEGSYTEAEQVARGRQLFRAARKLDLLVAPMLEVSPVFRFWEEFPANIDELVRRASWLLDNFGDEPTYLRVYDQKGRRRHVIWLIESIHVGDVDPQEFAAAFDRAAEELLRRCGRRVGFVIDPTPLPAYGSHAGPEPAALRTTSSVLAINPFNLTSQGPGAPKPQDQISEDERLTYARDILTTWSSAGIPLIAPILPGYDAHIVFPDNGIYGFHADWLRRQRALALEFATAGLSVDTWNGWTEGYAIPPSVEDGARHLAWVRRTVAAYRHRSAA